MPPNQLPEDINHILTDLERRLGELERGSQLGNAGIQEGAVVITDANGTERVRLGLLKTMDTGKTYGLRMSSGLTIIDNDIAGATYQPQNAENPAACAKLSSTYGNPDTGGSGPNVTVTVSATGNLLVVVGAQIAIYTNGVDAGYMSYAMTGANVQAESDDRSANTGLNVPATTGVTAKVADTHLYTSLNPGVTTLSSKYRGSDGTPISFQTRYIFAIPL